MCYLTFSHEQNSWLLSIKPPSDGYNWHRISAATARTMFDTSGCVKLLDDIYA